MQKEKRLIYADNLREEIESLSMTITGLRAGKGVLAEFMKQYRDSVLRIIDEQPTVKAEPVRHGKWKYGVRAAVCSECGFERHLDDNFGAAIACPDCGARMDY